MNNRTAHRPIASQPEGAADMQAHHPRRPGRKDREQGQIIVLFALCLVAIIAMAGLLIDGGMAWGNRRAAQSAADAAALAAAKAAVAQFNPTTAGRAIALTNGFATDITNCAGTSLPGGGVVVNRPPLSGLHIGDSSYVEVITTRKMFTTFAGVVGQNCWMVSARAVASVGNTSVAQCSFCSLNESKDNHTLVLHNGATLRVDGDIYVNSSNGGYTPGACALNKWNVCGDGFDVFGAGGSISARTISTNGGWETHDNNIATADFLAIPGCEHPNPPSQVQNSNVCIHRPQINDPLNDPSNAGNIMPVPDPSTMSVPVANSNGCTAVDGSHPVKVPTGTPASPVKLAISSSGWTLCPGVYNGGIAISGSANVKMLPGVYYMAGGGFSVIGASSADGSAGVMVYSSSGGGGGTSTTLGSDPLPASDKTHIDVKGGKLKASDPTPNIGDLVTYTMTVSQNGGGKPAPTGSVVFYDGPTVISGCTNVILSSANGKDSTAACVTTYATWGSHQIAGYYCGWYVAGICSTAVADTVYNPDTETANITVNIPPGSTIGAITLTTTGNVKLFGPTSGRYSGLTIFQDRTSNLQITISPGAGLATCTGTWLTADVPHVIGPPAGVPPDACGPLGGIRGTIYAANPAALVFVTASGLANLQVIAGQIEINSDADARFAFTPSFFANGNIHLVE